MLRIALCDDEKAHQEKIGAMLAEYPGNDINLKVYSEAEKLLEQIEWDGKDIFDLYILDVIMPGMSGIELGERLRDVGVSAPIIYLTTSKDYAVDSYNVRAFHYLLKPVEKTKLFSVLSEAEEQIEKSRTYSVTINASDGVVVVDASDILYAELYARSVRYHMTNGAVIDGKKLRASFQKAVSELLTQNNFMMIGSSFLVNLHHIKKVGKSEMVLVNGETLTVPKGARKDLLSGWMDYWLENNIENRD